jgi:hypothetical protein
MLMAASAPMSVPDKTMLIGGIVLFLVLVIGLIALLVKGKKFGTLLPFFILPIGMIGFSEISVFKGPWGELDKNVTSNFTKNPDDPNAASAYRAELTKLEEARAAHPNAPLPAQTRSNLMSTVNALSRRQNLAPESRLALSHAQLLLGQTNAAESNLHLAVAADTNLVRSIDPRLRALLKRVPN